MTFLGYVFCVFILFYIVNFMARNPGGGSKRKIDEMFHLFEKTPFRTFFDGELKEKLQIHENHSVRKMVQRLREKMDPHYNGINMVPACGYWYDDGSPSAKITALVSKDGALIFDVDRGLVYSSPDGAMPYIDSAALYLPRTRKRILYDLMSSPLEEIPKTRFLLGSSVVRGEADKLLLTHCMYRIRQEIGDNPRKPTYIRTAPDGYEFIQDVERRELLLYRRP